MKPIFSKAPEGGPGNGPFHKSSFLIYLLFVPAFLLLMVLLIVAQQYKQLKILVAPAPVDLPYAPQSRSAEDRVTAALKAFLEAPGADTLALSAEDLNHLARASRTIREMGWKYHLEMADTLAVIKTSFPASEMRGPAGKLIRLMRVEGYLNSEIHAYPRLDQGKLILVPLRARMNGEAAPPTALTKQGDLNPRDWVEDRAAYDRALARLASVRIRDGRLLIVRKP